MKFDELISNQYAGQWLLVAGVICLLVGLLIGLLIGRRGHFAAQLQIGQLQQQIKDETTLQHEREQLMALVSSELGKEFGDMAQRTMRANSDTFLQLAEQNLGTQQQKASSDLAAREKAVENLVKPIREALERSERQINALEQSRSEAYGSITEQIIHMQKMAGALQHETRNLVTALRRPEVRGQWGEITLRRLVELAGMVEHCDFTEQQHTTTDEGAIRPDLIIRMPDDRELVVDVKTPLDAYLSAVEATTDSERKTALVRHAKKVSERIRDLASKAYWSQFSKSPEFVILFIPGDQFLSAALGERPELIDEALQQNIILATPTSFIALLKAVAYGWRQLSLAENAEQIRTLAVDLHDRLAVYGEHMNKIGRQLDGSVKAYNQAVGSLERSVLPGARKFKELGLQSRKEIPAQEPVDSLSREITAGTSNTTKDDA